MERFKLHYHIVDDLEGTASVIFDSSEEDAQSCSDQADYQQIVLKDGKVYYNEFKWNSVQKKYEDHLIELERVVDKS